VTSGAGSRDLRPRTPVSGVPGRGRDRLSPARDRLAGLLREGATRGQFSTHLPADVLALALESLVLGLLQAVNDGLWHSDEPALDVARACLIAVGVPGADADTAVAAVTA
jgi:hypothetical protein